MSRALVELAQRGVEAEAEARPNRGAAYRRFLAEADAAPKNEAGNDPIRQSSRRTLLSRAGLEAHACACKERQISLPDHRRPVASHGRSSRLHFGRAAIDRETGFLPAAATNV